jgi:hypothetical protein
MTPCRQDVPGDDALLEYVVLDFDGEGASAPSWPE